MPRTTIVLQTEYEPLGAAMSNVLDAMFEKAAEEGMMPKTVMALVPNPDKSTMIIERSLEGRGLKDG